jgi:hypothetical protein
MRSVISGYILSRAAPSTIAFRHEAEFLDFPAYACKYLLLGRQQREVRVQRQRARLFGNLNLRLALAGANRLCALVAAQARGHNEKTREVPEVSDGTAQQREVLVRKHQEVAISGRGVAPSAQQSLR